MRKIIRYAVLVVAGLVLAVTAYVLYEYVLTRGETPAIDTPRGIASLDQVELGGAPQWILIRGHDVSNPVILFLHGGPGMPAMFLAHAFQRDLERDFVVVRGANLVASAMEYDVSPAPLEGEIPSFAIPVYFFLGRYDYNTPSVLAAAYLERLDAPRKGVVWFEDSAHFPFFEEPDRFREELLALDEDSMP